MIYKVMFNYDAGEKMKKGVCFIKEAPNALMAALETAEQKLYTEYEEGYGITSISETPFVNMVLGTELFDPDEHQVYKITSEYGIEDTFKETQLVFAKNYKEANRVFYKAQENSDLQCSVLSMSRINSVKHLMLGEISEDFEAASPKELV